MVHTESVRYNETFQPLASQELIPSAPLQRRSLERLRIYQIDDIKFIKNGIDVHRNKTIDAGTDYEDICFRKIVNDRNDRLFLGPHLIDRVLGVAFHGKNRPDAFEFDTTDSDIWVLRGMHEFKLGITSKTGNKLNGLSALIDDFRGDDIYLPEVLRHSLPEEIHIPERIIAPPDSEIVMSFLSTSGEKGKGVKTEFKLTCERVPAA